jgi:hypothetical protein
VVLIAVVILWIVMGFIGHAGVKDTLARKKIIGTGDSSIAGQLVDTGGEAREFADVMRKAHPRDHRRSHVCRDGSLPRCVREEDQ